MARIKIVLPDKFIFTTTIPVRISDINYGGHLGNDSLLSLIHEARIRFLASYNYSELDVAGAGLIQTDAVIIYKTEAFHGDILNIELNVSDFSATGCNFVYRITRQSDAREIARASTGLAFYDYKNKRVLRVPQEFKDTLSKIS